MKIKVLKFGGTSVGSIEAIKRSANIIYNWSKKTKVIAVLSAMSGETDRLIDLAKSFSKSPNPIDYDNAISTGESVFFTKSSTIASKAALVILIFRCFGPLASAVM